MDLEDALRWVDKNCYDEATVQRLRSRKVARTLADEVERLREEAAKWKALAEANARVLGASLRRIEREERLADNASFSGAGTASAASDS